MSVFQRKITHCYRKKKKEKGEHGKPIQYGFVKVRGFVISDTFIFSSIFYVNLQKRAKIS